MTHIQVKSVLQQCLIFRITTELDGSGQPSIDIIRINLIRCEEYTG